MTCHHREYVFTLPGSGNALPRTHIGDPRRCRCVVNGQPDDHCHQLATQEDMLCDSCRGNCHFVSLQHGKKFAVIDIAEELVPRVCAKAYWCPKL